MNPNIEELKKKYDEKAAALKIEKADAIKKAKAKARKEEAADRAKLRKQDTHIKILIGGYILAEIKKSGDTSILDKIAATTKNERDIELIKTLKGAISQPSAKKPEK